MIKRVIKKIIHTAFQIVYNLLYVYFINNRTFLRFVTQNISSKFKIYKFKYKDIVYKYHIPTYESYQMVVDAFWDSERESRNRYWLEKHLENGDRFLNVGGNVGTFVLFANKIKELRETIVVEPNSACISLCLQNMILNQVANTKVFCCAAGDENNFKEFFLESLSAGYYGGRLDNHQLTKPIDWIASEHVIVKKLDDLYEEKKLALPNLFLMDIDGYEVPALKGMRKIISSPQLRAGIIEVRKRTLEEVLSIMNQEGFSTPYNDDFFEKSTKNRGVIDVFFTRSDEVTR